MKKLIVVTILCLVGKFLIGQDLIRLTNGQSFFANIESVDAESINYALGKRIVSIPIDDVAFIEYLEGGVDYIHPETLQTINPDSIESPVYKKGNRVYIPFSSDKIAHRSGSLKLRELVSESGLWQIADCIEESHFVMEFVYSETGKDHGFVNIKDRHGVTLYQTPNVYNSDFVPSHKGQEMAEVLYKRYIKKFDENKKQRVVKYY